jgi:hypothetical protein
LGKSGAHVALFEAFWGANWHLMALWEDCGLTSVDQNVILYKHQEKQNLGHFWALCVTLGHFGTLWGTLGHFLRHIETVWDSLEHIWPISVVLNVITNTRPSKILSVLPLQIIL